MIPIVVYTYKITPYREDYTILGVIIREGEQPQRFFIPLKTTTCFANEIKNLIRKEVIDFFNNEEISIIEL